ncbi:MAG: GHMP family kinase ATP-binding protein [Promethearchaeota archaeon]
MNAFGKTTVVISDVSDGLGGLDATKISINGEDASEGASTTRYVVSQLLTRIAQPVFVEISHEFDLPMGCGYGASGAGALGTAIGLSLLLGLNLTQNQAGRIAHIAEVISKTGLGTVGGQFVGGFSLTTEAGFPFTMEKLMYPPDLRVVCGTFGKILTSGILKEWSYKKKISKWGEIALKKTLQVPNVKTFMEASREFLEGVGLVEALDLENVKELLTELDKARIYGASMNQLGQSVFACCKRKDVKGVLDIFESFTPDIENFELKVHPCGPELLENYAL